MIDRLIACMTLTQLRAIVQALVLEADDEEEDDDDGD